MTELGHAMQSCEMPQNDFVYLAEDVDELLEEKDNRIAELEKVHEKLRLRAVEALRVGDLTNDAQKMISALEGES